MAASSSQAFLQMIKSLQKGKGSPSTPSDASTHQFFQHEYRRSPATGSPKDTYSSIDESPEEDVWPATLNYDDEAVVEHADDKSGDEVSARVKTPTVYDGDNMSEQHPAFDSRSFLTQSDRTDLQVTTRSMTGTEDRNTWTGTSAHTELPPPTSRLPSPTPAPEEVVVSVRREGEDTASTPHASPLISNSLAFFQALHAAKKSKEEPAPSSTTTTTLDPTNKAKKWINNSARAIRNLDQAIPLEVIKQATVLPHEDPASSATPIISQLPASSDPTPPPEIQSLITTVNDRHIIRPRTSLTPPLPRTPNIPRRYDLAELKEIGKDVRRDLFMNLLAREGKGRVVVRVVGAVNGGENGRRRDLDTDENETASQPERSESKEVQWPWSSGETGRQQKL
ncbi:MAG: hypothetical protein Q9220_002399 [cf. Caloplaca sp. 1 TL-2023]